MKNKAQLLEYIVLLQKRVQELEDAVYNTSETKRFTCQGERFSMSETLDEKSLNIYFEKEISITPISSNAFKVNVKI